MDSTLLCVSSLFVASVEPSDGIEARDSLPSRVSWPSPARPGQVHGQEKDVFDLGEPRHKQGGHAQHYSRGILVTKMSRISLQKYM